LHLILVIGFRYNIQFPDYLAVEVETAWLNNSRKKQLFVFSGFIRGVNEIFTLLGYYSTQICS